MIQNSAINDLIAPFLANQIAGFTSDFKMNMITNIIVQYHREPNIIRIARALPQETHQRKTRAYNNYKLPQKQWLGYLCSYFMVLLPEHVQN